MLKKCLRYDLKSIFVYWIFGAIAMLIMSIPGGLALRSQEIHMNDTQHFPWEIFVLMIVYFVGIAFFILTEILVYVRFYKHFFSDEGYLTFTLPVKRRTLFTSKVLNGVIFQAASITVIIVSVIIMTLFIPVSPQEDAPVDIIGTFINEGWVIAYLLECLVLFVILLFLSVLFTYLIITIGATIVRKNKILVTIGIGYGVNFVISILSYIIIFGTAFYAASVAVIFPSGPSNVYLFIFLVIALLIAISLTVTIIMGLITLRIIERKLNLA